MKYNILYHYSPINFIRLAYDLLINFLQFILLYDLLLLAKLDYQVGYLNLTAKIGHLY